MHPLDENANKMNKNSSMKTVTAHSAVTEVTVQVFLQQCKVGAGLDSRPGILGVTHRQINKIDTKAKCRHLKKLTCIGTLRQVFIRVRLEILSVMLVFSTQLCELLPL